VTSEPVFLGDEHAYTPTAHARGPWDPNALHGGAPAALLAGLLEQLEADLPIVRLDFQFLRPAPLDPLTAGVAVEYPGRRVQRLRGTLTAAGKTVLEARALCVKAVPAVDPAPWSDPVPDPPSAGRVSAEFSSRAGSGESFGNSGMEVRFLGEGAVWLRPRRPILAGSPTTPLMRLVAAADFGNGVSAILDWDRYVFINADLSISLIRRARGEWIGLRSRTVLEPGGGALSESLLYDESGVVGRATQTLLIAPRDAA
jgi:hypothetical protein